MHIINAQTDHKLYTTKLKEKIESHRTKRDDTKNILMEPKVI